MFISPSVFSPSCAVWASLFPSLRLCATLSIIAIGQLLSKHCNLAAGCCSSRTSNIPNLLMSGTRPPVVSARLPDRLPAWLLWLLWLHGSTAALAAQLFWLLWLPAFIPYAKVKKLILTHYILFIWKNRCFFFPMLLFLLACCFPLFPMDLPGSSISATAQPLATEPRPAVSLPLRRPWPAASSRWLFAAAPQSATNLIRRRRVLRFG